jgi:hypothetical protein
MKTIKFTGKNELIDNLLETFENSNDITLVVDYETIQIFLDEYDDEEEFDYYAISIANDTNLYYITKIEDIHFSIIEAKYKGEYKPDESAKVIILDEVYDNEILDYIETKDIEIYGVESIYNDLDFKPEHDNECTCCGDCCNCYYDESEAKDSYFDALNDVEKEFIIRETGLADELDLEFIAKIYLLGYNNGVDSGLLSIKDAIDNALEEE